MYRNRISFILLCLLISGGLLFWDDSPHTILSPPPGFELANHHSSMATGARVKQYDREGKIEYRFNVKNLRYFQKSADNNSHEDKIEMDEPRFILYQNNLPLWHMQSAYGLTTAKGDTITLLRDVVAWKQEKNGGVTDLKTSKLIIKPDEQFAETDKPVTITTASGKTNAVGMTADLQHERITLLSNVRSIYEPSNATP